MDDKNNFQVNVRGFKALPTQENKQKELAKDDYQKYKKEANRILEENNKPGRVIDNNDIIKIKVKMVFLGISIIIFALLISGSILYLGFNDKFKSIINSTCSLKCPDIPANPGCPGCTNTCTPYINITEINKYYYNNTNST